MDAVNRVLICWKNDDYLIEENKKGNGVRESKTAVLFGTPPTHTHTTPQKIIVIHQRNYISEHIRER